MPLLTITRGSFGASRQVADTISRELGCDVVTRETVIDHARKYGMEETGMAETDFMEKQPPQLWDRHSAQRRLYLIYLRASLMDFVEKGNLAYLGHMGQFVLSDVPKLLRIRVDASMDFRLRAVMEQSKMSEAEARKHIKDIDATRRSWARFLYGVNYDLPRHYDLVLNLERMDLESAAQIIICALKRPEWEQDEETMKTIRNVHVASILSARLARSPRTRGMEVVVQYDSKTSCATVKGLSPLVGAKAWTRDIKEVLADAEGVESVKVVDLR